MDNVEILEEQTPEYYDVIPEFNSVGRLCNYHTGDGETVRVMANEWERFNQLAGRQHEIVDGVVAYNPNLDPCTPDELESESPAELINALLGATD